MEEQIHKWLNGELSESELAQLMQNPEFVELAQLAKSSEGLVVPEFKLSKNWNTLIEQKNKQTQQQTKVTRMKRRRWISIAVTAAVALLTFIAFQVFDQKTTARTVAQDKMSVPLPDGSSALMNAVSKVRFNEKTFAEKRIIELEGEAQFIVRRSDRERGGFLVKTDRGLVRVIGTNFNVYARKDGFRVECYTGKVEARNKGQIIEINPGERVTWSEELQAFEKDNHYSGGPSWDRKESIYKDAPLDEVTREIERQYGLKIKLDIKDIPNYTGGFPHDDLQTTMDNIVEPFGYRYLQEGRKMRIWEE